MQEIELPAWGDFERVLRLHARIQQVLVRNFDLVTFDDVMTNPVEVDSLKVVRETGTDRRANANMWNVPGFDHEHDIEKSGQAPNNIIYAYLVDLQHTPYTVSMSDGTGHTTDETCDLTTGLTDANGIIVYDPKFLKRRAPNEYWFIAPPMSAALFLFRLE